MFESVENGKRKDVVCFLISFLSTRREGLRTVATPRGRQLFPRLFTSKNPWTEKPISTISPSSSPQSKACEPEWRGTIKTPSKNSLSLSRLVSFPIRPMVHLPSDPSFFYGSSPHR